MKKNKNDIKRYIIVDNRIIDINNAVKIEFYITNAGNLFTKYIYYGYGEVVVRTKIGKVLYQSNSLTAIINKFLSLYNNFICDTYYLDKDMIKRFNSSSKLTKNDLEGIYKIRLYNSEDDKTKYTFLYYKNRDSKWKLHIGDRE